MATTYSNCNVVAHSYVSGFHQVVVYGNSTFGEDDLHSTVRSSLQKFCWSLAILQRSSLKLSHLQYVCRTATNPFNQRKLDRSNSRTVELETKELSCCTCNSSMRSPSLHYVSPKLADIRVSTRYIPNVIKSNWFTNSLIRNMRL